MGHFHYSDRQIKKIKHSSRLFFLVLFVSFLPDLIKNLYFHHHFFLNNSTILLLTSYFLPVSGIAIVILVSIFEIKLSKLSQNLFLVLFMFIVMLPLLFIYKTNYGKLPLFLLFLSFLSYIILVDSLITTNYNITVAKNIVPIQDYIKSIDSFFTDSIFNNYLAYFLFPIGFFVIYVVTFFFNIDDNYKIFWMILFSLILILSFLIYKLIFINLSKLSTPFVVDSFDLEYILKELTFITSKEDSLKEISYAISGMRTTVMYYSSYLIIIVLNIIFALLFLVDLKVNTKLVITILAFMIFICVQIPFIIGQKRSLLKLTKDYSGIKNENLRQEILKYSPLIPKFDLLTAISFGSISGGLIFTLIDNFLKSNITIK